MAKGPKKINYYSNNVKRLIKKRFIFLAEKIKIKVESWIEDTKLGEKITNYIAEWEVLDSLTNPDKTNPQSQRMAKAIKGIKDNYRSVRDTYKSVYRIYKDDTTMEPLLKAVWLIIDEFSVILTESVEKILADGPKFVTQMGKQNKKAMTALGVNTYLTNITTNKSDYDVAIEERNAIEKERNGKFTAQWELMKDKLDSLLNTTEELNKDGKVNSKTGKTVYPYDDLIDDYSLCFKQLKNRIDKEEEGKDDSSDEKK